MKDFIAGMIIAIFTGTLFYLCMSNSVKTMTDMYFFYIGVFLPFILPFYLMFKDWREHLAQS